MKIKIISAFSLLVLLAQTTVSCNSCADRNNDPIPSQTPEVSSSQNTDEASGAISDGSSSTTSMDGASSISTGNGTPTSNSGSTRTSSGSKESTSTTNAKKKPAKSGYSAPNGTDAENHDGDPYTKHDTTSMPTGTSIR